MKKIVSRGLNEAEIQTEYLVPLNGRARVLDTIAGLGEARVVLFGGTIEDRWVVATHALKRALGQSKSVAAYTLSELIDSLFEGKGIYNLSVSADVLWLRLDFKRSHSYAESTTADLLLKRSKKTTLITSSLKVELPFQARKFDLSK